MITVTFPLIPVILAFCAFVAMLTATDVSLEGNNVIDYFGYIVVSGFFGFVAFGVSWLFLKLAGLL